jgi:putative ABC transport system permease protein
MQNYAWGIQKENIVYLPIRDLKSDSKTFCEELKKNPHIVDFTEGGFVPGGIYMGWGRDFEGQQVSVMAWPVTRTFLHFFGVQITEGRDFSETDDDGKQKIIFNQEFLKKYKLKDIIGKQFNCMDTVGEIIGIAKDVNFESLHTAIRPMAFVMLGKNWNNWLFIKITGQDTPATIDFIKRTWVKHSDEEFDIKFLNESLDNLYKNENNLAKLISIFGLVIIIIAIMGVYGLIMFNTRYKAKEIAIRKVNGSSVKEIMLMLNRTVLLQMGIAYAVATPLAYYVVYKWLTQFAYKTTIYWWVFALAGALIFIITIVTVSWQSYRAATTNPVEAIKRD